MFTDYMLQEMEVLESSALREQFTSALIEQFTDCKKEQILLKQQTGKKNYNILKVKVEPLPPKEFTYTSTVDDKRRKICTSWLGYGRTKETERLLIATQNNAIRTQKNVKARIGEKKENSQIRLCGVIDR